MSYNLICDFLFSSTPYSKSSPWSGTLPKNAKKYPAHQFVSAGFTLIEVMISMIVLAIGLLGIAMMQVHGMNFTTGAYARTQASYLVNEILDEMRMSATPTNYISTGSNGNCSPLLVSDTNNLACWYAQVGSTNVLPNGGACISSASGVYTVEVYWSRLKTSDASSSASSICGSNQNDVDSIKIDAIL
ncbi:MAG TPA: type IV pilus modification protein PilV [Gammaproteobacteria bacterium]|nr:type IV pilus modification protein PilV [Gammaproteobacteria bacterium]